MYGMEKERATKLLRSNGLKVEVSPDAYDHLHLCAEREPSQVGHSTKAGKEKKRELHGLLFEKSRAW